MNRKTALITGASSGLGTAFARSAATLGHDVVLVARRLDRLQALAIELSSDFSIVATPVGLDLARPDAHAILAAELAERKINVDILVNNAGYTLAKPFLDYDCPSQRAFVEVMSTQPMALIHQFLPGMRARRWGRILNISSVVAFSNGAAGHTLYPATKAFMLKMSRSLAAENKRFGIHVSAICPGSTATEFMQANGIEGKDGKSAAGPTQTPEAVVAEAWRRNERGDEVIVTGWLNKVAVGVLRYAPEFLTTPLIRKVAEKANASHGTDLS